MKTFKKLVNEWNAAAEKIQAPVLYLSEAPKEEKDKETQDMCLVTIKQGSEIEVLVKHYYLKKKHKKQYIEEEGFSISLAMEEENIEVDDILTDEAIKTVVSYQEVCRTELEEKILIKTLLKVYSDFVIDAMVDGVLGEEPSVEAEEDQEFEE